MQEAYAGPGAATVSSSPRFTEVCPEAPNLRAETKDSSRYTSKCHVLFITPFLLRNQISKWTLK